MSENFYNSFMAYIYDFCDFWGKYRIESGHAEKFYKNAFKGSIFDIVEFGTATGITSIPLAREGHNLLSIDLSSEMQIRAADKLRNEDVATQNRIKFRQGDVFEFYPDKLCSAIIIPDSLLLAMGTFDKQIDLLKKSYNCLENNGLLVLDVFQPLAELLYKETVKNKNTFFIDKDKIDVYSNQNVNLHTQLLHVHLEYVLNNSAQKNVYDVYYKYIFKYELIAMLKMTGFEILEFSNDFYHYSVTAKKISL